MCRGGAGARFTALYKLSVCACVQYAEARRKLKPKSDNLQGEKTALTYANGHTGRASKVL